MQPSQLEEGRIEIMMASVIYLMTHYARTGCPRLAICVSGHLQCIASHADAAPVLRDICAALHGTWQHAAEGRAVSHQKKTAH